MSGSRATLSRSSSRVARQLSFSTDLWDGFPAIAHRAEVGLTSLKNMLTVFKKRIMIEEQYAKSLQSLMKGASEENSGMGVLSMFRTPNAIVSESGTVRGAWEDVLDNANLIARAHTDVAQELNEKVISTLQAFIRDYENQMKKMISTGKQYLADLDIAWRNVDKSKASFHKSSLEAELSDLGLELARKDVTVKPKEFQQLTKKATLMAEKVKNTKEEYEDVVKACFETQHLCYSTYLPKLLDEFQTWETTRMRVIKTKIRQFTTAQAPLPRALDQCNSMLEHGHASIDPNIEIKIFIEDNKSYNTSPESPVFEPYVSPIDRNDPLSAQRLLSKISKRSAERAAAELLKSSSGSHADDEDEDEDECGHEVFGKTLEEIMKNQPSSSKVVIPVVQQVLTTNLFAKGACESEGIFRVPAPATAVTSLKKRINKQDWKTVNDCDDVSVFAAVLKLWFRTLASPLVPDSLYGSAVVCGTSSESAFRVFKQLPSVNQHVLTYLVKMMLELATPEHVEETRMNESNLAMVFAPSICRCPSDDPNVVLTNAAAEKCFVTSLLSAFRDHVFVASPDFEDLTPSLFDMVDVDKQRKVEKEKDPEPRVEIYVPISTVPVFPSFPVPPPKPASSAIAAASSAIAAASTSHSPPLARRRPIPPPKAPGSIGGGYAPASLMPPPPPRRRSYSNADANTTEYFKTYFASTSPQNSNSPSISPSSPDGGGDAPPPPPKPSLSSTGREPPEKERFGSGAIV